MWFTEAERPAIDSLSMIRSFCHSIRWSVKLPDGSFQMNKHVMHAIKTGDVCIYLTSLHLSFTWICPESMSGASRGFQLWSLFV
jgi:hypothetical protein